MTPNKLYAQCRREAIEQLTDKYNLSAHVIIGYYKYELSQLTAEIYGMKLLEVFIYKSGWEGDENPQQLHDHLVEQFNKEEWK